MLKKRLRIHREGLPIILSSLFFSILLIKIISILVEYELIGETLLKVFVVFICLFNLWLVYFFRVPRKGEYVGDNLVISPADGKVVSIEPITEKSFFGDRRMRIAIFMSPFNAHVNWAPINGFVREFDHYPGRYIVAFNPKSSEKNEHTKILIDNGRFQVVMSQIAGFIARRIKSFVQPNSYIRQGEEVGFIKFGSRVDIVLPYNASIKVKIGDRVKGGLTVIAALPEE